MDIPVFLIILAVIFGVFLIMGLLALFIKPGSVFAKHPQQQNPMEGKKVIFIADPKDKMNADGDCGHLEAVGESVYHPGFYERFVKRGLDIVLSFFCLILLSPLYLVIMLAIVIDDPGPVLFAQKRVGRNKRYFKLHKFRSMTKDTPNDVPTHMLGNPERYITKVGRFIRAHSLDELPQIWDIFIGNMSFIGPRPGLWNQDTLTAERDKYGANDVKPGLTGWAQINGRDTIDLQQKARLDGDYCSKISFWLDCKCFFRSFRVFRKDDTVIEGSGEEPAQKDSANQDK